MGWYDAGTSTEAAVSFDETELFAATPDHLAFPGFVIAGNGDFLIFYRSGADHGTGSGTNGTIIQRRSTDGGDTWGSATTILTSGSWDYRGAVPTLLSDGRLALSISRRSPSSPYNDPDGATVMFSDDHGATWGTESTVTTDHVYRTAGESAIVELPDGTLLYPIWGQDSSSGAYYSLLMASDDDGVTWAKRGTIAQESGHSFNELGVIRVDDGRLVALVRDESGGPDWYRTTSDDDGVTWSTPAKILDDAGARPNPIRLPDGRMMAVWRDMTASGLPGTVGISDDEGATWEIAQQLRASGYRYTYSQADIVDTDLWLVHAYEHSSSNGGDDSRIYIGRSDLDSLVPVPAGGGEGQVLTKASSLDGHLAWRTPTATESTGTTTNETVFAPDYTVTDTTTINVGATFVWGIDGGSPYYNSAGVTAGDEAVLVLDNDTGTFSLRPVEV